MHNKVLSAEAMALREIIVPTVFLFELIYYDSSNDNGDDNDGYGN